MLPVIATLLATHIYRMVHAAGINPCFFFDRNLQRVQIQIRDKKSRRIIFVFIFVKVDVHLRDKAIVEILILHRQARSFVFTVLDFQEILKLNYNNSEIFVASLRYVRRSMFQWEIFGRFFKDVKNSFWRISGDKISLERLIWINCSIRRNIVMISTSV